MAAVILDDRLPLLISWILFTYIARADRQDIITQHHQTNRVDGWKESQT